MAKSLYQQFLPSHAGTRGGATESEILGDICLLFQACLSVEEACRVTRDWFRRQFPEISGDIALFSEDHEFLETVISWGDDRSQSDCFRPAVCWAVRRGRPHHVSADCEAGVASCQHYGWDGEGWHLCLPLMASGQALGLLHLHGSAVPDSEDEADMSHGRQPACDLDVISESLSMAIVSLKQRETLQHQAIRDPLTQLFNRRYLEYTLEREMHRVTRAGETLTVAILDVDYFKQFNDTHGHDAGDALLQAIGAALLRHMRGGDIACRFGGEEFALVYPGMPEDIAVGRLESIREEIAGLSLNHRGKSCERVTISAGIAVYPQHGDDTASLINLADQALYKSKESGRNRVTVAPGTEPTPEAAPLKLVHDSDHAHPGESGAGSHDTDTVPVKSPQTC